jgi:hypothetical protein
MTHYYSIKPLRFVLAGICGFPGYKNNEGKLSVGKRTARDPEQLALSPDGHYLVIGRTVLRVWDLWNLPEQFEDRLPMYRHDGPFWSIQFVNFVAPEVVETSSDGIQR